MHNATFKKTNPFLSFLLTNITLGVYVPYWFISRRHSIEQLGRHALHFAALKVLFVLYLLLTLYYYIGDVFFTEHGRNLMETMNIWLTFFGLGITYYSVFRVAESIERNQNGKVFNRWLLVLLHIWYLQYKINKTY